MSLWFFLYLFATFVSALNGTAEETCQRLKNAFTESTFMPTDEGYNDLSIINWSETAWATPICIAIPKNTSEVESIVSLLTANKVKFAIRSGGHSPSPLASNTNDGVLIDLSGLRTLEYDAKNSVVHVGSGFRWAEVYAYLGQYKVMAVGGRANGIGVGGVILGSGLSYLTDLYGLACDNVVNFEVVLANGTVVNANSTSHTDLFRGLKGSSNNLGLVTTFTLRTYPIHEAWGGAYFYSHDQLPDLYKALAKYQSNPNKDPYANLMLQPFATNESLGAALNIVYLKPEENPAAFEPFYAIKPVQASTRIQTLTDMISGLSVPPLPRWDWHSTSFTPSAEIYEKINNLIATAPEVETLRGVTGGTLVLGLQPISSSAVLAGNERGGNSLGLQPVNQTWLVLDMGWSNAQEDKITHEAVRSLLGKITNIAKESQSHVDYIFMNDASWDQPVIASYGAENVKRLQDVRKRYDPEGLFQELVTGGFKIPS